MELSFAPGLLDVRGSFARRRALVSRPSILEPVSGSRVLLAICFLTHRFCLAASERSSDCGLEPWAEATVSLPTLASSPGWAGFLEAPGHIGIHSHKDRPSVVYFVQGTDTVTRDDGTSHTFHPGDMTGEPGTTVHSHKNDGKDDAIIIAVDVLKKETPK
jgi:mannose-6-phosphate isomerase-like protein (cupin superfamily)